MKQLAEKAALEQIIRVDHAGEYGAVRICKGQLAAMQLMNHPFDEIEMMLESEQQHLSLFSELIETEKVRPSALLPLWHGIGYTLGFTSAIAGKKYAMSCIEGIETAISQHYAKQIDYLSQNTAHNALQSKLEHCKQEEEQHLETSSSTVPPNLRQCFLRDLTQAGCQLAILLSRYI